MCAHGELYDYEVCVEMNYVAKRLCVHGKHDVENLNSTQVDFQRGTEKQKRKSCISANFATHF